MGNTYTVVEMSEFALPKPFLFVFTFLFAKLVYCTEDLTKIANWCRKLQETGFGHIGCDLGKSKLKCVKPCLDRKVQISQKREGFPVKDT